MKADLHVHSTASDGSLAPSALVAMALERGLDVLAIADHDSVEGLAEALAAARGTALKLIPAVELSASDGGHDVHVLAYFVDHTDARLLEHLADLRVSRLRRAGSMVAALCGAGYDVSIDAVLELSGGGAVGRSHVAAALVDAGHAESVSEAFRTLIGRGRPFYVSKDARPPRDVIATIVAAGGLPVIAHPGVTRADELLPGLVASGLRGIEAFHADHTPQQRSHYAAIARQRGLLVTGGSDYHGPGGPNPALGSVDVPSEAVEALLAAGRP
ncbi:MAG: PHP domain-containing protein [Coriobacteriia bacterium]|nr:PHP domain-containing protein [Coriobacteriia bacterium]